MIGSFEKALEAELDFAIDWSAWLRTGETITVSTWAVQSGLTKGADSVDGAAAIVWISGGNAGVRYVLTNTITTSAGRRDARSISVTCLQR
jgi:hypothetical protein